MIPSLLQIPSAVSDSKLHSVLPNNGKGDFTFERSTGATIINRKGLIEEVGYFSSELVQNGNFSELGSELVTNGDFATDSNWTINANATIANGFATFVTGTASLQQTISITTSKTYRITYKINSGTGSLYLSSGGFIGASTVIPSTVGTHIYYATAVNTNDLYFVCLGSANLTIDNVSVKQVDPNDDWTLNTGWAYGTNKAEKTAGTGSILSQSNVVEANKKYKVSFDVVATAGYIDSVFIGGQSEGTNITASGSYSYIFDTTNTDSLGFNANSSFAGSVTNISVVEVQGDRPRLSYDITNGVVDSQPHLLLEPSSTNLATFSEDFSQWSTFNLTAETNTAINPKGTSGCYRIFVDNTSNSNLYISTASIGTSYTISLYAKSNNANKDNFRLRIGDNWSSPFTATNEWQRFTYSTTATGSGTFAVAIYSTSGTVSSDILIFGAQVETTSYATSYIPTAGTTITRAAETCNNSKPSVNSTEGVLYAEIQALADDLTFRLVSVSDGTNNNTVKLGYRSNSNNIYYEVRVGGSATAFQLYSTSDITQFHKVAVKYKVNDFAMWVNGTQVLTDTSGAVPTGLSSVQFTRGDSDSIFYGKVKGLAVYNEALSESQLMQLTGVTATSIYDNFVTRTASYTVEALGEVKKVIDNL